MIQIPKELRDHRFRFIKLKPHGKEVFAGESCWSPAHKNYNPLHNYPYNSKLLQIHLDDGGNYGVVCGIGGLIVVDCDHQKLFERVLESIGSTFTVQTGRGQFVGESGGYHCYYYCPAQLQGIKVENGGGHYGEVKALGGCVVGPGSIHPNGKAYRVIDDRPVKVITPEQLNDALGPFVGKYHKQQAPIKTLKRRDYENSFNIEEFFDLGPLKNTGGGKYQGTHPKHGSSTGTNFTIDLEKQKWYCFRHQKGGGAFSLHGLMNDVFKCEDVGCINHTPGTTGSSVQLDPIQIKQIETLSIGSGLLQPKQRKKTGRAQDNLVDFEEMSQEIMQEFTIITDPNGESIYIYNEEEGIYKPNGEIKILQTARKWALENGEKLTNTIRNEILSYIRDLTGVEKEDINGHPQLIHLGNCILDMNTLGTQDFTPDIVSTVKVPIHYNAEAGCPSFLLFIKEILQPKDIPVVQEMIGYILRKDYIYQKAFIMLGEGANGKSTLLNCVLALIGEENVSSLELQHLAHDRFAPSELMGRLANICPDMSAKELKYTGMFKQLMGDWVRGDRKHKNPIKFKNFAKLIFSANQLPKTQDDTTAFFRRWVIVDFPHSFLGLNADTTMLDKITTEEELQGILNWSLLGLRRLMAQGVFSDYQTPEEMAEYWTRRSNPLADFVKDHVEETGKEEDCISKTEFYDKFKTFWKRKPLSPTAVNKGLVRVCNTYEGRRQTVVGGKKNTERVWRRIRWKEQESEDDGGDSIVPDDLPLNEVIPFIESYEFTEETVDDTIKA